MKLIIELDGVILDAIAVRYRAHQKGTSAVGWSCLDEKRFRRVLRKGQASTDLLPGAPLAKAREYEQFVREYVETNLALDFLEPLVQSVDHMKRLLPHTTFLGVSLGANIDARSRALERAGLADYFQTVKPLSEQSQRREIELKVLAGAERRCAVIASTDALVRSAGTAGLMAVGVSTGTCAANRLFQAGADLVYAGLDQLADSLDGGAQDLIRAGLLPLSLG